MSDPVWIRWPSVAINPCGNVSIYAAVARDFLNARELTKGLYSLLMATTTFRDQLAKAIAVAPEVSSLPRVDLEQEAE